MNKSYYIKNNFFFDECEYKKEYYIDILSVIKQPYSYIINFSDILKVESDEDFISLIKPELLPLFPPIIYLDCWPNITDKESIKYYNFLLDCVICKMKKYKINPIISFVL